MFKGLQVHPAKMGEQMKAMAELMKIIFPVAFVMASGVDTYLNYWAARAVLRKLGHQVPDPPGKA